MATIHASNSRAKVCDGVTPLIGIASKRPATVSLSDCPRSIASTSARPKVQPTTMRMRPAFNTSPSIPRAATASALALKYPVVRS